MPRHPCCRASTARWASSSRRRPVLDVSATSRPLLDANGPPAQIVVCARRGCRSARSEEHTSELQSLMRISYAVFCLKKKKLSKKSTKYSTPRRNNSIENENHTNTTLNNI